MIFILTPNVMKVYQIAPLKIILISSSSGLLFGMGQIGSALAISLIGIGLTFMICLGVSMSLGFLLPLIIQHPDKILTPFGMATMLGTVLAVLGLIFSTHAGKLRHSNQNTAGHYNHPKYHLLGIFLAFTAGLFSAGQNLSFSLTFRLQQIASSMHISPFGRSIIMWPIFLTFAFIPYAVYMIYLLFKNRSFRKYKITNHPKNYYFTFLMGAFWYGSLVLYSKATRLSGPLGPIFGWPIFMVLVILASNFWSLKYHEWKDSGKTSLAYFLIGLLLLISSILILAISSKLA